MFKVKWEVINPHLSDAIKHQGKVQKELGKLLKKQNMVYVGEDKKGFSMYEKAIFFKPLKNYNKPAKQKCPNCGHRW